MTWFFDCTLNAHLLMVFGFSQVFKEQSHGIIEYFISISYEMSLFSLSCHMTASVMATYHGVR